MGILRELFAAVLVLGVVIILHELGHFLVARFFKIRIEVFSIGFGPRLFGFRRGDTDYRISGITIGGYVKFAGDQPGEDATDDPGALLAKPRWQTLLVAFAGPFMNIIIVIGLLTGLFM